MFGDDLAWTKFASARGVSFPAAHHDWKTKLVFLLFLLLSRPPSLLQGKAPARPLISRIPRAGTDRFKSQKHPRIVIKDLDRLEPDRVQVRQPEINRSSINMPFCCQKGVTTRMQYPSLFRLSEVMGDSMNNLCPPLPPPPQYAGFSPRAPTKVCPSRGCASRDLPLHPARAGAVM